MLFLFGDTCLPYVRRGIALSLGIKMVSAGTPIEGKGCICYHCGLFELC